MHSPLKLKPVCCKCGMSTGCFALYLSFEGLNTLINRNGDFSSILVSNVL